MLGSVDTCVCSLHGGCCCCLPSRAWAQQPPTLEAEAVPTLPFKGQLTRQTMRRGS